MSLKEQITAAIAAHGQWKVKFREFMDGKLDLDPNTVQRNDQCQFGKWLESDGKKQLPATDFADIHRLHTEFHKVAAEVVRKKKAGNIKAAQQDLDAGGAFATATSSLTKKMMAVKA